MTTAPSRRGVGGGAGIRVAMLVRNPFTHDTRVEKEAKTLARAGYAVTVVAEAAESLPPSEHRDGYDVVRVARPAARVPLLRFFAYRTRLTAVLVRLRPHIVHAHDTNAMEAVAAAARQLGVPWVYDAHELWLGTMRRGRSLPYWWAFLAYYWLVERRLMRRAAAVITVSPPIARHLERAYHLRRVELVPNYPGSAEAGGRRELRSLPGAEAIPPDAPIVLYLGGVMPGRGIEQLIQAMRDVPQAHLLALGSGSLMPAIRLRAAGLGLEDRFHVLEPVPGDEVVAYAASASVGVVPYVPSSLNNRYSLPNKLFQYMAAGIPVVASDFEQVREIVRTHGAGIAVDMRDPRQIARALRRLLGDPAEATRMGANGRRAVERDLNWETSASVLLSVYARVTATGG